MPTALADFFDHDRWLGFDRWISKVPAANIQEQEHRFVIELAVPGMEKNDFKIDVENGTLMISAEKREENEAKDDGYTRKEFSYNSFSRSFLIPESVNLDQVRASYSEGVLKLELPKREEAKTLPKKEIKVS